MWGGVCVFCGSQRSHALCLHTMADSYKIFFLAVCLIWLCAFLRGCLGLSWHVKHKLVDLWLEGRKIIRYMKSSSAFPLNRTEFSFCDEKYIYNFLSFCHWHFKILRCVIHPLPNLFKFKSTCCLKGLSICSPFVSLPYILGFFKSSLFFTYLPLGCFLWVALTPAQWCLSACYRLLKAHNKREDT